MHRTQGEDFDTDLYQNATNKRGYKPESGPNTDDGTRLPAEAMNAIQEELANLITACGVAINADAASDRSAGWAQLTQAILNSAAIDTAAIADSAITGKKINSNALSVPLKRSPTSVFLDIDTSLNIGNGNKLQVAGVESGIVNKPLLYKEAALSTPQLLSGNVYQCRGTLNIDSTVYEIVHIDVTAPGPYGNAYIFTPRPLNMPTNTGPGHTLGVSNRAASGGAATNNSYAVLDFDISNSWLSNFNTYSEYRARVWYRLK